MVTPYNFLRPPRISKERRGTLNAIHQRFGAALQPLLGSRLRQVVDVTVASVDQVTFGEFRGTLGSPTSAFIFDVGDGSGTRGVLEIGTELAYQLIDRMFGGPGLALPVERALTPLEQSVLKGVVEHALGLYADAWQEHLRLRPTLVGFESMADQLAIATRDDAVLVAALRVKAGGASARLALCVPLLVLESFLRETGAVALRVRRTGAPDPATRARVEANLRQMQLPLVARFPVIALRARVVAALAPGQVIDTGVPLDTPVEVLVNGRPRLLGAPGKLRRYAGVRVLRGLEPGAPRPKARRAARVV